MPTDRLFPLDAVPLGKGLADIAWMLGAAALVMLMQGGFCFLESGLSRAKNSINVAIKNLIDFCISIAAFWAVGFALMFGAGASGFVGTTGFGLEGMTGEPWLLAFFVFQAVFCGTATTIVSGAVAERMRFPAYLLLSLAVSLLIYPVFGHWAWGGVVPGTQPGWLAARGFVDFAGSTVVHSIGGWVALAAALLVGPRLGRFVPGRPRIHGHNIPMATLGALLLWFGWFGFNGGSTLGVTEAVPLVLINTNLAAAFGGMAGLALAWVWTGRPEVGAVINGVLAGLVAVTAGCHAFDPWAAAVVGAVGGLVAVSGERLLERLRIDDVVGAVPVHAFAGAWGTLAVALLADLSRLGTGLSRLDQLQMQGLGVLVGCGWALLGTFVLVGIIRTFVPLRVAASEERDGLNVSEHGANTELIDLITGMTSQRERADFSARVAVEPHTEVGQIAAEYNRVLERVAAEIAKREQAAEAAQRAEEKYRSFFENAIEGIFQTTPAGRYLSVNPALARIYGYESPAVLMATVADIGAELYVDPARRAEFVRLVESQEVVTGFESQARSRDGAVLWISETARAVRDANGRVLYYEGTVENVTGRKQTADLEREKEAAEARDRAKSSFLANMSHEIRTPLNGVIGMLGLLADGDLNDRQAKFVRIAGQSAESLLGVINDILDFSKIEAGKLELERVEFNLHELVESVAEMFSHRAAERELELTCFLRSDTPVAVLGDPERLRQILVNLTGNAVKFTERGEVRLEVAVEPSKQPDGCPLLCLSVSDTGIGISPERAAKLFTPFTQVDASNTRKYGGTGLGLAICRQLAELMGGTITVESRPGQGSTFRCCVPLEAVCDATRQRRRLPERLADLRVLAVDDNATNRELLSEQLTAWGFEIDTLADPLDAMRCLSAAVAAGRPYQLVLLDHQMPGLDGLTLATQIKATAALRQTALLLLTSIDCLPTAAERAEIGLAGALSKPLRQSRLFDAIIDALHGTHERRPNRPSLPTPAAAETVNLEQPHARILVAEDNETNQLVTTELLRLNGFDCEVAADGAAALQRLAAERFDLVLMDCQMPRLDGFEATAELRRREAAGDRKRMPVVALTANAVRGDRERCLNAGMDDYITKPIDPATMLATIRKYLPNAPTPTNPSHANRSARDTAPRTEAELRNVVAELSPKSRPHAQQVVFDRTALLARCLGNEELADRVLVKFAARLPKDLRQLEVALAANDGEAARRAAHGLKGAAGNVAAEGIAVAAAAIEGLAEQSSDPSEPLASVAAGAFQTLLEAADVFCETQPAAALAVC